MNCETAAIFVAFVYPVVTHWAWGDGWLASNSLVDVSFKVITSFYISHIFSASCSDTLTVCARNDASPLRIDPSQNTSLHLL